MYLLFLYFEPFGEGNGNPLQYSCLENSMDKRAWWAIYSPWGYKELDKTGHSCVKVSFTQVGSCFFFFLDVL